MLHIVLLILKTAGIFILAIIVLLLILAAAVIVSPLVYKAELSAGGSAESIAGSLRFHWLFHLLEGRVVFENGELTWKLRAGWKKFGSGKAGKAASAVSDKSGISAEGKPKTVSGKKDASPEPASDKAEETKDGGKDCAADASEAVLEEKAGGDKVAEQKQISEDRAGTARKKENGKPDKERIPPLLGIAGRFRKFTEKIKYTFRKICDKIKLLMKKKERITAFLQNTIHQEAFSRLVRELRRLFHFLRPVKASADLEFGFTDPAYTGYTLALAGMICPLAGDLIHLKPDFERRVLRGSIYVKGKLRILYALIFALNMLLDKNVRTTYRHIRKFRL